MSQFDYIRNIAKYGLENDQEQLLGVINELIEHSKNTKKVNFAIQLQSLIKDSLRHQKTSSLVKTGSEAYHSNIEDREINDLILEKVTSSYTFNHLVADSEIREELELFIQEHRAFEILRGYDLPVANKILLHGPSGCGKTLASYIIAGELQKMMIVVNLGAIVSSKLGETSKNLSKIFRKAASEDCIIFMDEFDSLGKVRDYSQDHGEMKRIVNTILQLFDYLPQSCILVAATNQKEMLDDALLRRFDVSLKLNMPNEDQIFDLVSLTLKKSKFHFPPLISLKPIIEKAIGLSYYSIQKTLISAIKRSIFLSISEKRLGTPNIDVDVWKSLIESEKKSLHIN